MIKDKENVNNMEIQDQMSYSDNQRFECAFSEKAMRKNIRTILYFYIIPITIIFSCICFVSGTGIELTFVIFLIFVILPIVVMLTGVVYLKRMYRESYLEIAADNMLMCHYKGHRDVCYPIEEIKSIEKVTLKQAEEKHVVLPVVLNLKGEEFYSENGVMITFNRSWIKSVFPVYFNPADVEGFIDSIKQRMSE